MRTSLLNGSLREFSLGQWLSALGLSRQYLGLEVRASGAVVGAVFVKGGRLMHAEAEGVQGLEAWFRLQRRSDGEVDVFSSDSPDQVTEPLASIDELLRQAPPLPAEAEPAFASPPPLPSLEVPALAVPPPLPGTEAPALELADASPAVPEQVMASGGEPAPPGSRLAPGQTDPLNPGGAPLNRLSGAKPPRPSQARS